jgi:hypothetical protein
MPTSCGTRVIQEIDPFMSESDIAAGARWLNEIDQQLEGTSFAIVCVTRDNQSASWLNFEAGAVAKTIDTSRVVPLAIDLTLSDLDRWVRAVSASPGFGLIEC